jgi:hypothetical protein
MKPTTEEPSFKKKQHEPLNSLRWIESKSMKKSTSQTKFLPLPGGEGRGEGERKHKTIPLAGSYFFGRKICE